MGFLSSLACQLVLSWLRSCLSSHVSETAWGHLLCHTQKTQSDSRHPSPLDLTIFPPTLLECSLSLGWRRCVVDVSLGLGSLESMVFSLLTTWFSVMLSIKERNSFDQG